MPVKLLNDMMLQAYDSQTFVDICNLQSNQVYEKVLIFHAIWDFSNIK